MSTKEPKLNGCAGKKIGAGRGKYFARAYKTDTKEVKPRRGFGVGFMKKATLFKPACDAFQFSSLVSIIIPMFNIL